MMKVSKHHSLIRSMGVDARPAVPAGIRQTLLDVVGAHRALEALRTATLEFAHRQ